MIPIEELHKSALEDVGELSKLAEEAKSFLSNQKWCKKIIRGWLDRGWGKILGIFYFAIEPVEGSLADSSVWVITGDLPSAYIDISESPNGACALDAYVGAMQEWIDHVRAGKSIDAVIPVNVEPTSQNAKMLQVRLELIDKEILSKFADELSF